MKKLTIILAGFMLCASLCSCGGNSQQQSQSQEPEQETQQEAEPEVQYKTVDGDGFSYEVGENWTLDGGGYDSTWYLPENGAWLSVRTSDIVATATKNPYPIEDLDGQWDYLLKHNFTDESKNLDKSGLMYSNIQKGIIGNYAAAISDVSGRIREGDPLYSGKKLAAFLTPTKIVIINYVCEEPVDFLTDELNHSIDSFQIADGSKFVPQGEVIASIPDNHDTTELDALIATAESLDKSNYTYDSWAALESVLNSAKSAQSSNDIMQFYINESAFQLKAAIEQLVEGKKPEDYQMIPYTDLARNPDAYIGQSIQFSGRVLQVSEGDSEIDVRLATSGNYDDVVLVAFPTNLLDFRLLEDDWITAYGISLGVITYETVIGGSVTIPGMFAESIVLQ